MVRGIERTALFRDERDGADFVARVAALVADGACSNCQRPLPMLADLNKEVATLYGMIMPGESKTETSRCVFIIDPNQVVRAMIYYPLTTGRNMDEILRLIDALQTTDKHGVATPANWRPGDQVIVPAPKTIEAAAERAMTPGIACTDWYFAKRDLPK
jgi:peroxiredoxin (alkyl hydroperoxide reductase subunit C)